jgi:hypothetical protein
MSGPLENMYNCFLFNRVPPAWENAGYPCLKVRDGEMSVLASCIHQDGSTIQSSAATLF